MFWSKNFQNSWTKALFLLVLVLGFSEQRSIAQTRNPELHAHIMKVEDTIRKKAFASARMRLDRIKKTYPDYDLDELCHRFVRHAIVSFYFDEVYRLNFQKICRIKDPELISRGIVYLSFTREKALLTAFLDWFKNADDEEGKLVAFISLLPKARLSRDEYLHLVHSFSVGESKRGAYLAFISHFPFHKLIKDYLKFREKHASIPGGSEDSLIQATSELMKKNPHLEKVKSLFVKCQTTDVQTKYEIFWRMACVYFAKQHTSRLSESANHVLQKNDMPTLFSVVNQLQSYSDKMLESILK